MNTRIIWGMTITLSLVAGSVRAADWPQFRGPNRDGHSADKGLLKKWPEGGPKLLWTFDKAGGGYSSPAVVGDRLYLTGARGKTEFLFAIDLKTQAELWAIPLGPTFDWKGNSWNSGPSSSPSVAGDLVFALGGSGDFVCVSTAGALKWRTGMTTNLGGAVNAIGGGPAPFGWGYDWAPLVDGEQVICVPGGKKGLLAALDVKTGNVLWRSAEVTDEATYSSPIVADIAGVRQYVAMTNDGTVGVEAKTGKLLWHYHRKPVYDDCVIPTPIYHDNHVYTTVGFGFGCDLIKISKADKFTAASVYSNKNLMNREGGVVLVDGNVYGHSFGKGWVGQEWMSGKIGYTDRRNKLGSGAIIVADGLLYVFGADEGTVVLATPNPKKWEEISRFELPKKSTLNKPNGKLWTHPVIANGKLYLRDQELLFCFDLTK